MMANNNIHVYAISSDGSEQYIDDLYWFEEMGVHDFAGEGLHGDPYKFRFEIEMSTSQKISFIVDGGRISELDLSNFFDINSKSTNSVISGKFTSNEYNKIISIQPDELKGE